MIHIIFWSDYVTQLAWERLGILLEELEEVSREREVWVSLLRQLPPRPGRISGWKWMDGWMDITFSPQAHISWYPLVSCWLPHLAVVLQVNCQHGLTMQSKSTEESYCVKFHLNTANYTKRTCWILMSCQLFAAFNEILTVTHTSFLECIALVCAYPAYFMFKWRGRLHVYE